MNLVLSRKSDWPAISQEEIVKRSRILVIDDQDFPYQQLFERDGYTVSKWDDIQDLSALERGGFDLILLDLVGVGRTESEDQGLGVLKHIRETQPAQLVIAYSSAEWPLKYQPFFDMADEVLQKTADYLDFKRAVDELLAKRFSLGFYLDRILAEAGTADDPGLLEAKAMRAILKRDPNKLRRYLARTIGDPSKQERILQIAEVAVGIMNLWKN
jgi:CheY-like chemotaxis protein